MQRGPSRKIFEELFSDENGFDVSMRSRKKHSLTEKELTYGEVEFDSFWDVLDAVKLKDGEVFYDLGCGIGKPVFIAQLHSTLRKSVGVELLPEVYEKAVEIENRFSNLYPEIESNIVFLLDDITTADFYDANVVFLPSTCFDFDMLQLFSDKTKKLKSGSRIITLTKELRGDHLRLTQRKMYQMSWGATTVNVFERV